MHADGKPQGHGNRCPAPCGKLRFLTRKDAKQYVPRLQVKHQPRQRAYECELFPGYWHLTTQGALRAASWRQARRSTAADAGCVHDWDAFGTCRQCSQPGGPAEWWTEYDPDS